MNDNKTVHAEIQGRFFSQEEADQLKAAIDRAIVTDPKIRAEAARCWEGPIRCIDDEAKITWLQQELAQWKNKAEATRAPMKTPRGYQE